MVSGGASEGELVLLEAVEGSVAHAVGICAGVSERCACSSTPVRLGLACLARRPAGLESWLSHHREIGVETFLLLVDSTPELRVVLEQEPWCGCVLPVYEQGHQRDYHRLKDRQEAFLRSVIPRAQEAGLTHLLHIDTDELIYCHEGVGALHAFLAQHATSADIHMLNMEALVSEQAVRAAGYSRDFDPFRECFAFWHHRPSFSAYSNGKSFCSLQAGRLLRPMGPHHFTAEPRTAVDVPPRVAVVLHYECCSFELWREKYTELVRSHDAESIERIPFEFYRESMRFAARLLKASGGGDVRALANAENDARQFWFSWKRMPLDAQRRASEVCQGASGLPRHLGTGKRPCCVLSNGVTLLWVFKGQAHDHKAEAMYTVLGAVKEDRVEERLMLDASVPHEQAMVYASRLRVLTSKLNSSGCRYGSKELVDAAVQAGMPLGFRIRLRHALDAATCTGDLESSP